MKKFYVLSLFLIALVFAACATAHQQPAAVSPAVKQIRTVFVWDADGASDMSLLKDLKAEAKKSLKEKGLIVADDPNAVQAYVKVTVNDAKRDYDSSKSFVNARLYVVDAVGGGTIYDKTAEAGASGGGGYSGPEYPVEKLMKELLSDYPATGAK